MVKLARDCQLLTASLTVTDIDLMVIESSRDRQALNFDDFLHVLTLVRSAICHLLCCDLSPLFRLSTLTISFVQLMYVMVWY